MARHPCSVKRNVGGVVKKQFLVISLAISSDPLESKRHEVPCGLSNDLDMRDLE